MSPIVTSLVRRFGTLIGVSDVPISVLTSRVDDPLVPLQVIRRLHCGATQDSPTDLSPVRRGLAIFSPSAQLALPSHIHGDFSHGLPGSSTGRRGCYLCVGRLCRQVSQLSINLVTSRLIPGHPPPYKKEPMVYH